MIELKELTAEEYPAAKELFRSVFMGPPWFDDWSDGNQLEDYLRDLMGARTPIDLALYEGGRMIGLSIGCVKHWCGGTEYFIDEFCIANDCQGRGLGKRFLELIEEYLAARDIHQIFLMTQKSMPACGFYKHLGFEEIEGLTPFFKEF